MIFCHKLLVPFDCYAGHLVSRYELIYAILIITVFKKSVDSGKMGQEGET